MKRSFIFFILYASCFFVSPFVLIGEAMGSQVVEFKKIQDIPLEKWELLAQKKIFFGHQSVGLNIVDGIIEVMRTNPSVKLNILEISKIGTQGKSFFAHSKVGENRDPISKVHDFVEVVGVDTGNRPEVAFLKFCYVDAFKSTPEKVYFLEYKEKMKQLQSQYPKLQIIHFTMPLKVQKISWKTKFKLMIGRDSWELTDNIKRNEYNFLLRNEYLGKEPVFDIATYEATLLDGTQSLFKYKGNKFQSMQEVYSDDGGHLNKIGSKLIAEQLLIFLANNIK